MCVGSGSIAVYVRFRFYADYGDIPVKKTHEVSEIVDLTVPPRIRLKRKTGAPPVLPF